MEIGAHFSMVSENRTWNAQASLVFEDKKEFPLKPLGKETVFSPPVKLIASLEIRLLFSYNQAAQKRRRSSICPAALRQALCLCVLFYPKNFAQDAAKHLWTLDNNDLHTKFLLISI